MEFSFSHIFRLFTLAFCASSTLWFMSCGAEDTVTPQTGSVRGNVLDSETGQPIALAFIATDPPTQNEVTDQSGFFFLESLQDTVYTISAGRSGFTTASVRVTILAGDTISANISLERLRDVTTELGSIRGVVTDAVSNLPLSDVILTTNPPSQSKRTDSLGQYSVDSVLSGNYTVQATLDGYVTSTVAIRVVGNTVVDGNLALLPRDGTIIGIISQENTGVPISNVQISTRPASNVVSTDSLGMFSIQVQSGSYTVIANTVMFSSDSVEVMVEPGREARADISLTEK